MSNFNQTKLTGSRVLVRGTDKFGSVGETVLDSAQWEEIQHADARAVAGQAFDDAIEDFFSPLLAAAEKLDTAVERSDDPSSYIVLAEAEERREGAPELRLSLTKDSIVLRILENNDGDRLVWVNDELEVLAVEPAVSFEEAVADVQNLLSHDEPATSDPVEAQVDKPFEGDEPTEA